MKKIANEMYCKYQGQLNRQDAYVYLDCEREELSTGYNAEIGNGIGHDVFNGQTQRWECRPLTESSAEELLTALEPLAELVVAGYTNEWNGNNYVGSYDENAQEAISEIAAIIERYSNDEDCVLKVWDAEDWFVNDKPAVAADTDIEALESRLIDEALGTGMCDVLNGVSRYLENLQYHARQAAEDEEEKE